MVAIVMALLCPGLVQDEKANDEALAQFEKDWRTNARNPAGRRAALTPLTGFKSEKILDSLIAKLGPEREEEVREALVRAIGTYGDNAKSVDCLIEQLDSNLKMPAVRLAAFESLTHASPKLTRPRVDKVNARVRDKDVLIAAAAVRTLGGIRHKSSLAVLVERLRKCQQDMRQYIEGSKLPNCDGG